MSLVLLAPVELPVTAVVLPTPKFGNTYNLNSLVKCTPAMKTNLYTYIRKSGQYKLSLQFRLTAPKKTELMTFFTLYNSKKFYLLDNNFNAYRCLLITDPLVFNIDGNDELQEVGDYTLEFLGDLM